MTPEQNEEIKARRKWHVLDIMRSRVADGFALFADSPLWPETVRQHYCNSAADLLDHIDACHKDIDTLIAENERLRNTKAAFLGAMQHIFDTAHYINERDDEYELRDRLERIEQWARRFEGVDVTAPVD